MIRAILAFILLCGLGAMPAAATEAPAAPDLSRLAPQNDGEQKRVFQTRVAWETFWINNGQGAAPVVDFDAYDLVLYIMGQRPTGGYSITLTPADSYLKNKRAIVVEACFPPQDFIVTTALTYPAAALLIPKSTDETEWKTTPCKRPL